MRTVTLQACLALTLVGSTTGALAYVSFRQLSLRGMQAEARLLLSYMQTLQNAYHMEEGRYARFDQPYGASIQGADHCEQPQGAAQLGFVIPGCHDIKAPAPRYAFRSLVPESSRNVYRLEAEAGSDEQNRSLVCFAPDGRESWALEQNTEVSPVQTCW